MMDVKAAFTVETAAAFLTGVRIRFFRRYIWFVYAFLVVVLVFFLLGINASCIPR